jgi:hypothetical protein
VTFLRSKCCCCELKNGKGPNFGAFSSASVKRFADFLFKSAGSKRISRLHNVIRDGSARALNFLISSYFEAIANCFM